MTHRRQLVACPLSRVFTDTIIYMKKTGRMFRARKHPKHPKRTDNAQTATVCLIPTPPQPSQPSTVAKHPKSFERAEELFLPPGSPQQSASRISAVFRRGHARHRTTDWATNESTPRPTTTHCLLYPKRHTTTTANLEPGLTVAAYVGRVPLQRALSAFFQVLAK